MSQVFTLSQGVPAISPQHASPAIIVPVMEAQAESALAQVEAIARDEQVDVIELRIDRLDDALKMDKVVGVVQRALSKAGSLPVIVTFRTLKEGGCTDISPADYSALNKAIIERAAPAYIDVEFNLGAQVVEEVIQQARKFNVAVIVSSHDFNQTSPEPKLVERLEAMRLTQADVIKMAVMPKTPNDVLALMAATATLRHRYPGLPMITMSMGRKGVLSRVCGEFFGSNATFGTLGKASAPGQVAVENLQNILGKLHLLHQPEV
ncbi:3-dehydroquinate dehydratase [Halomonadaceae bacterium LMG 33818]|uniref:type I 3-dehydroquinate dehydratase n=1 Tax=Cernens ardua TaxID=3402176 RepID=UPI003EDB7AF7